MAHSPLLVRRGAATVPSDGMKKRRKLLHSCRAVSAVPTTAARLERFDARCSPVQRISVPGHDPFARLGGVLGDGSCGRTLEPVHWRRPRSRARPVSSALKSRCTSMARACLVNSFDRLRRSGTLRAVSHRCRSHSFSRVRGVDRWPGELTWPCEVRHSYDR